jgi:hypothetical protein
MGARWLVALALSPLPGVACSGGSFNTSPGDASTADADDDASRRPIVVVPSDLDSGSGPGDGPLDDGGHDAPDDEDVVDRTFGDAATDARATCASAASCTTAHATTSMCDGNGACLETRCDDGYLDCDGNRSNGCETEWSTLNCGGCGVFCNPSHVNRAICSSTTQGCLYNVCQPGYLDCDGDASDGCETPSDGGACP